MSFKLILLNNSLLLLIEFTIDRKVLSEYSLLFSLKTYAHGTIIISGVEHNNGYIDVKIYTDKESFLKEKLAAETIRKKATKGETIMPWSKLHEGIIAIYRNDGRCR